MNFQDSSNREASMISSFQMILEDGSIHLNGEALRHRTWVLNSQCRMKFLSSKAMQKLLTSQLKTLLPHGFKLHLGTTRAILTTAEFLLKLVFLTLKHWPGKYMREAQNVGLGLMTCRCFLGI
ncbi:uncharacterized protein [Euphorbia lathyris]|uniref:uncharacterized protein isoform X3 n=1 Tax=Euphorbia lathyris TaxID=212925 RepID=UPI0033134FC6